MKRYASTTQVYDIVTREWTKKRKAFRSRVNAAAERSFDAVTDAYRASRGSR